jgi:hypothetical protein
VTHPGRFERLRHRANRFLIGMLMGRNGNGSVAMRA